MARTIAVEGKKRKSGGIGSLLKGIFSRKENPQGPSAAKQRDRIRARREEQTDSEQAETELPVEPHIKKRVGVAQQFWGEGFSSPFNQNFTDALIQPINIEKGQELLEIGSSLGGCANYVSKKLGIRITALEQNKIFVDYLDSQRALRPPGHLVEFGLFDPVFTEFRPRAYSAAIVKDTMFSISDKEGFLKKLKSTLRTSAHLAICDFVLSDKGGESGATDAWRSHEQNEIHLLSVGEQLWNFRASGFQPVTQKDITDLYLSRIKEALPQVKGVFEQLMASKPVDKVLAGALLDELTLWLGRSAVLESGDLRVYYFHAVTKELSRKMN